MDNIDLQTKKAYLSRIRHDLRTPINAILGYSELILDIIEEKFPPLRDDVINMMNKRPKLKERATVAERITNKITEFVETFISGIAS